MAEKDIFIKGVLIVLFVGCTLMVTLKTQLLYHVGVRFVSEIETNNKEEDVRENILTPSIQNKTIVYNCDVLREKIAQLHSEKYDNTSDSECLHRDPTCLVIGVAKSGTKELVEFASLHPNIVSIHGAVNPGLFHTSKVMRTRSLDMMPGEKPCAYEDQTVLVKSDNFLANPEMPKILHEFNPKLKLILIVRDPIERMKSSVSFVISQRQQHKMRFTYKPDKIPEMDSWFVNLSTNQVRTDVRAVRTSTYHIGLERYLEYFPMEQIFVVESNEFKHHPVDVLQRLENFLTLKPVIDSSYFTYVKDKGFYCINSDQIYCYGSDRGRTVIRELRPKTISTLKSYFEPHNNAFFKLIGKSFDW